VVQTADFGSHHDAAGRLDGASHRSILAEREVRARSLVVRDVGPKDSTKGRSLKTMTWEFFARQVLANHSLGLVVSATTVRTWLRAAGLGPAGRRGAMTWREFVRAHRRSMLALISSPSRRCGCNDCTCCSSLNWQPPCAYRGLHGNS
jgi:hypothetical protein